jgi:TM2 domain-containing membrane protein YozV
MYRIIGADGRQYGPVLPEQLRQWIREGRAVATTPAQAEGAPDWKALNLFAEFVNDFPPPPAAGPAPLPGTIGLPPNPAVASKASSKIAAGICGILLGGFGVHKFILGYTGAGIAMLLVSLLSCFVLYGLMHLIGLIEGILYLTKNDEEFVRVYVDGHKAWF